MPYVLAVAQAFKESHSLEGVAQALQSGIRAAGADPIVLRGSDGGDGLLDALAPSLQRHTSHVVSGPLGAPVDARVGWFDAGTAVIESRMVCGLALVAPPLRDPRRTSTRGLGELIQAVIEAGSRRVYVGLGGSATMDGGVGMARAWGWVPRDAQGTPLVEGGGALVDLDDFTPGRRPGASLVGLVDVRNPLTGPNGARVYAAQKGASPDATEQLAAGLDRLAAVAAAGGWEHLAVQPGAGAAGGLGFGLMYFGGAALAAGARWVLDRADFSALLTGADLVLCAEGAFDATSLEGKLTGEVLRAAGTAGVRAALLAPRAVAVPPTVEVETGGGYWTLEELGRRAASVVQRARRTSTAP
ncbi:MAG: glycerate kinase [Gemmatimonadetes bacterium]|nr:glycerate kinase [Gemmatimonadota bacterium]